MTQRLRLGRGVFNELDAVQTNRVGGVTERGLQRFAAAFRVGEEVAHGGFLKQWQ